MNHNYEGQQIAAQQKQSARCVLGGAAEARELREVEREVNRLGRAASDLHMLQEELHNRLERYVVQQPATPTPASPEEVVCSAAGTEIRELSRSLESTASGLRDLLQTLAI